MICCTRVRKPINGANVGGCRLAFAMHVYEPAIATAQATILRHHVHHLRLHQQALPGPGPRQIGSVPTSDTNAGFRYI